MKHFLFKLIPPRPTFPDDMTGQEGKVMMEHVEFWKDLAEKRIAVGFGPVADPNGVYGIAIIEVKDENAAYDIRKNDPAIKANVGFKYEIYPMHCLVLRK
jgi:uncharacterized protein YciI